LRHKDVVKLRDRTLKTASRQARQFASRELLGRPFRIGQPPTCLGRRATGVPAGLAAEDAFPALRMPSCVLLPFPEQ